LLFANFLLYGGVTTLVGATLPLVIRDFSWSYLAAGFVIASGAIGYFTTTFLAGIVVVRFGPRRLLTLGLAIQALGIGCFGVLPHVVFNGAALVLIGIGQGATEVATNYSVIRMEPSGTSRLMNLMHSAFTVGAVITPVLAAFLIDLSGQWRPIYLFMSASTLLVVVLLRIRSLPFAAPRPDARKVRSSLGAVVQEPFLWLLALMLFLYVGAEMGISAWISEFTVMTFKVSPATGALAVSTFWLGILFGRILTSWLYRGRHPARALVGFGAGAAVSLLVALVVGQAWAAALMFFATGLGFSAIYPLGMTLTGQSLKQQQGVAIGVVSTGGGLGACCFPFLMSAIANQFGILSGFWFYLGITLLMVLTMLGILLKLPSVSSSSIHSA
jgi:fucose permease